jgi:glycosyltransferase involved in cell wall biosynthesis
VSEAILRVALDVTPTIGQPTGVGNHVAGLVDGLRRRPSDVEVVPLVLSWSGRRQGGATHRPVPAKLRTIWLRADHPSIERFVGPVDIVHGTNFVVPPARTAAEIVTIHDLTVRRFPHLTREENRAFVPLIERAVRRGAWVHAVSQSVADEVNEWFPMASDRIRTIYAGIPTQVPADQSGLPYAVESLLDRERRIVLSIGTEEPRKGLLTLIDAVARLMTECDDVVYVHAGPRGWQSDEIDKKIFNLPSGIAERIFRLGYVSDSQRSALLEHSSVFAYPSVYEGFGLPPLEAMTMGLPVVATAVPALCEVLGDAALLVPVDDAAALHDALTRVLNDDALSDALSERGITRASRYRWDTMATEVIDLYRDAVTESRVV